MSECCTNDRLRILLRSDEWNQEPQLVRHLDQCTTCQSRLLELATDAEWQSEVESVLRESPERPASSCTQSIVIALDGSMAEDVPVSCEAVTLDFLGAPSHPEMLGRLGRYEIERVIGAGGMGIVLKGFDTELHRPVAIKVLAPHLAHSGAARIRFAREARAVAAITHDHVLPIHDVDTNDKLPYLVMPFVAGQSLQSRLDAQGPLPLRDILRIACQIAEGLGAAHALGIVHRDVKPANILLEESVDRARIMDFGLARAADDASITRSGIIAGTPFFMSPEQTRGERIDERSDLFSLGSVIYAMCTGKPPFRAETTMGVLRKISDTEPRSLREENPDIPTWLVKLVGKLMEKSPSARIQTAQDAAELLQRLLAHVNQPDHHDVPFILVSKTVQRQERIPRWSMPQRLLLGVGLSIAVWVSASAAWRYRGYLSRTTTADRQESKSSSGPANGSLLGPLPNALPNALPNSIDWEWLDSTSDELSSLDAAIRRLEGALSVPPKNEATLSP